MLTLYLASRFIDRLRGLRSYSYLNANQGLCLVPCKAIHTLGMAYAIDVVFLDKQGRLLKQVSNVVPGRISVCWRAFMVIELPSGYCQKHPGYLRYIHAALKRLNFHFVQTP